MTRQESYIAELSQLLFYMTAWDKAEVLKGITAMINHPETGLETMEELGAPMKLAVTLHRQYTPTPEPTPEELAAREAAAAAAAEAAAEELYEHFTEELVEESAEEFITVEIAEEPVEEPAEEAAAEAEEEEPAEETVAEAEEESVEAEPEAPAEECVEEAEPTEETMHTLSLKFEEKVGQEKIFAEIFNAATEAQSAVPLEAEKGTVRKARYLFLFPYIIFAVIIGVPATLVFALANVVVGIVALVSLAAVVYMVLFQLLPVTLLSSRLIILGMTLIMSVATILLSVMTVWFLRTATIGFPRFLIEVARKHGYREVEVQ